jgi:hypothetical protein
VSLISVCKSGIKETVLLKLETGEEIRSTLKHRFYNGKEWKRLEDLSVGDKIAIMGSRKKGTINKPFKGTGSGAHNEWDGESDKYNENVKKLNIATRLCQECFMVKYEETHHIDCDKSNNEIDNLKPVCRVCHKKIHRALDGENKCIPHLVGKQIKLSKIIFIGEKKKEMTYDISMPSPNNNFVANNIICHNSFNKSHAVSYGLISYLCAYFKAHHPMEFLVSCLNHARDDRTALKILRDAVENDSIKHQYFNAGESEVEWCVKGGILYGGFMTIDGMGPVKAKNAVKLREENKRPPKGMLKAIKSAISPFKYLYPAKELYGDYYTDPRKHNLNSGVSKIIDADCDGTFTVIGCLVKKNLRDKNEAGFVSKRNGKFLEGQTSWINITIEDDTGSIMCKIKSEDYLKLGKEIAETGKEDKHWYMVHGNKINGWSIIFVKNIKNITRQL